MTGSPFSNVLGSDPDSSTFERIETDNRSDTTDPTADRPDDVGTEGAGAYAGTVSGSEAGQNETAGDAPS